MGKQSRVKSSYYLLGFQHFGIKHFACVGNKWIIPQRHLKRIVATINNEFLYTPKIKYIFPFALSFCIFLPSQFNGNASILHVMLINPVPPNSGGALTVSLLILSGFDDQYNYMITLSISSCHLDKKVLNHNWLNCLRFYYQHFSFH